MHTKHHSDRTLIPQRSDLGYTPGTDEQVLGEIATRIGPVLTDMRRRGQMPYVNLISVHGRLILRVVLRRVAIALPVSNMEESWLLLGRAIEFEMLAPADAPQLRNTDFALAEAA